MLNKKIYALSAAAGFVFGSIGVLSTETQPANAVVQSSNIFEDVSESDWFYPYVESLAKSGIVNGMTENQFVPQGTFTVAESAAVITRYLGLEDEAQQRKKAMETLGIPGAEEWFSGYVQLMYEAGVIDVEKYGCTVSGSSVSIENPALLKEPVKRYEFSAFVMRSFELGGTQIETEENFITGGTYDESKLELYIPYINDYGEIPAGYSYYVLKAYYNGVFGGDNLGNFNPLGNLTRAEMAKVAAVVMDKSLRSYINLSDNSSSASGYVLDESCYVIKNGKKYLKPSVSEEILSSEAYGFLLSDGRLSYTPVDTAPDGYIFSVRHYTKTNGVYSCEAAQYSQSDAYSIKISSGDTVFLVLSDKLTGEAVDAYEVKFTAAQTTQNSFCKYNP